MATVFKEIWTGEMVKSLRGKTEGTWLDGIPDMSSITENDVIHLVDVGVDPTVLINNTTYPIPPEALDDKDIAIKLDKFQTKPTPITDDELYAASYEKMQRVKDSHADAINDAKFRKAAHSFCPDKNSATTPVLTTSGTADAAHMMMTMKDLIAMKRAMDKLKVPAEGRRLVLCPDHVNDLLSSEQSFKEQYNIDSAGGTIARLYGFDIYEYAYTPTYTQAGVKNAVGTDGVASSFAFYTGRVFKATGSTKMYYSEAATDPENQRNLINFRHYFIAMPKKMDCCVAIISGVSA